MQNTTTSTTAERDDARYQRWVTRQIGPRCVGGIYRCGDDGDVYEVLAIEPGPRPSWPTWQITVRTLGANEVRQHCTAWEAHRDQVVAEPERAAFIHWAEVALAQPADTGALLEQRHVLDEAAHPSLVAAFRRLALA